MKKTHNKRTINCITGYDSDDEKIDFDFTKRSGYQVCVDAIENVFNNSNGKAIQWQKKEQMKSSSITSSKL